MAGSAPSAEDGTNGDPAGYPAGVLAAAVLATTGVSFVLVGSAALWLRGESIPVGDADVVIEPGEQNMQRARAALADMALQPHAVPQAARLAMLDIVTIMTSYGKIDCLLGRGRLDWDRLRTNADVMLVAGAEVVVAASSDAWKLRRRFKDMRR
ncbi:MAG: hypothetical protein ABSF03_15000 [Streptosporangiaceae bacterium]|jgi:hypothetical protein